MKKSIKGAVLTLLFAVLMNAIIFTPLVSAEENRPTVWVKIYRIQTVDTIESAENGADWRYTVTVIDGENSITQEFKCPLNNDDIIVDRSDSFTNIKNQDVFVKIALYEDDGADSETADISSSGTSFDCAYNLASDELGGDETVMDGDYYKTSGDFDGSLQKDENDANLWLVIFDNYEAPVAKAGNDQSVYRGEQVAFDGSLSTASEGSSIVRFEWDFENDGIIDSEGENVYHTYNQKGKWTCRLVVIDSLGVMSESTCVINVINMRPEAEFTFSPSSPTIQDQVNVTDMSSDADGSIRSWFWDFGDGNTSTARNPVHTYSQKGEWKITLTVTDNDGAKKSTIQTVKVLNLKPEALFNCSSDIQTDMDVQFIDNSMDPENKSISWFWDFGDGNTSELQAPTHTYAAEGEYNVTLTVTDDENATDTYAMTISVVKPLQEDNGTSLWILATVAIAVGSIVLVGLIWWNRRRQSFSEMFKGTDDSVDI